MQLRGVNHRLLLACAVAGTILIFILYGFRSNGPFAEPEAKPVGRRPDILDDIANSTLGFQKIFVINLPARTDHRDAMSLAGACTGLDIEYVPGVTHVDERYLPPGGDEVKLGPAHLGNWRAHMDIARTMVERNIASALILEDDADWDIRIKSQMRDFARAARLLIQPLQGSSDQFLDPSYPRPQRGEGYRDFYVHEDQPVEQPRTSPYGDLKNWDMFWLGHCGCRFPEAGDENAPLGRAVIFNDETVPEPQHINVIFGDHQLQQQYPSHTRVVSRAPMNTCTLGYGLSLPGAKRLLYELGVREMSGTTDMMFRSVCDGVDGRRYFTCLTVQPQLFQHHRPKGNKLGWSNIDNHTGDNEFAFTRNIRWSTRVNFDKLIHDETDYIDFFKDGELAPEFR